MSVMPNSLVVIPLPAREVSGYSPGSDRNHSHLSTAAYRIRTSRPTTVYQFNPLNNPDSYSNDASMLIPRTALDESYLVLSWPGFGEASFFAGDNKAFVTITATEPDTRVRIVPSADIVAGDNVPAVAAGEEYLVTLGVFETLNLQSGDSLLSPSDLTGTRIEANKPIAVWAGVECVPIGDGCCCDHLEEQLYPRSTLGAKYVVGRSAPRGAGSQDSFRLLGVADGTQVVTSLPAPNDYFTLNRGETRDFSTDQDFTIDASKALVVGQFLVSQEMTEKFTGDPAFVLNPPLEQYRDRYIILVPFDYAEDYGVITVPEGLSITIDGEPAEDCTRMPAGNIDGVNYEALRCPLVGGIHTINATEPFGLVVMGYGPGPVSYAYAGGMNFAPINEDCQDDLDCPGEFCSGGHCVPLIE